MPQCSHSPHRQCLERRFAHSHWMPTSHFNLYSQASSQLSFADWERHSPWLTMDLWTLIISCILTIQDMIRSSDTRQVRLRSKRPFVPAARNLFDNLARFGIRASEWTNHKWKTEYCKNASRFRAGSVLL